MGSTRYDIDARYDRARKAGYGTKSAGEIFTQNAKRQAHPSMIPHGVAFRESRDSEVHPHSVPIILGLDVTGSMGHIPYELIREGLPKLMGGIIQGGVPIRLCFSLESGIMNVTIIHYRLDNLSPVMKNWICGLPEPILNPEEEEMEEKAIFSLVFCSFSYQNRCL
jgi:hypothetical protein